MGFKYQETLKVVPVSFIFETLMKIAAYEESNSMTKIKDSSKRYAKLISLICIYALNFAKNSKIAFMH